MTLRFRRWLSPAGPKFLRSSTRNLEASPSSPWWPTHHFAAGNRELAPTTTVDDLSVGHGFLEWLSQRGPCLEFSPKIL
jgi:hypothetical protein